MTGAHERKKSTGIHFFLQLSIPQSAIDPAFWARLGDHKLELGLSEEPMAITGAWGTGFFLACEVPERGARA